MYYPYKRYASLKKESSHLLNCHSLFVYLYYPPVRDWSITVSDIVQIGSKILFLASNDLKYPECIQADKRTQESNDTVRMNGNSGSTSMFCGLVFSNGWEKISKFQIHDAEHKLSMMRKQYYGSLWESFGLM